MENLLPLRRVSGDFLEQIEQFKTLAIEKYTNLYQPPSKVQLDWFRALATALLKEELAVAVELADKLQYELTQFVDSQTQQQYYRLLEQTNGESDRRGWGSYFFNIEGDRKGMVEVPHILADINTESVGAKAFLLSRSKVFLLAGAHRHANGCNTADVCDPPEKIFQSVHVAAVNEASLQAWQIHGFGNKHKFPQGTKAVISNGKGEITDAIKDLDRRFGDSQLDSYVYNKMPADAPENKQVNGGVSGDVFKPLGATKNVQGIYSNSQNISFVHIELSSEIREKESERNLVASVIAESIKAIAFWI